MNTTIEEEIRVYDLMVKFELIIPSLTFEERSLPIYKEKKERLKAFAQSLLSQGEPVKPYGYVYVSDGNFLFKQELTENERFVYSSLPVYKHLLSTEALQKDKADLIEYAKKQHKALGQMLAIHDSTDAMAHDGATTRVLARKVLATQQPKCMQGE